MPRPSAECDTVSGFARHKRLGEQCEVCTEANRAYQREYARTRIRQRPARRRTEDPVFLEKNPKLAVKAPGPVPADDLYADPLVSRAVTTAQQKRAAALLVCDRAGRGLDVQIPEHRAAAARLARPALEALGLADPPTPTPRSLKASSTRYEHGTRLAAQAHRDAGTALCGPCRRWQDVDERRAAARAAQDNQNGSTTSGGPGAGRPIDAGDDPGHPVRVGADGLPPGGQPGVQGDRVGDRPVREQGRQ